MPKIRISKEQVRRAQRAYKAALENDVEFRALEAARKEGVGEAVRDLRKRRSTRFELSPRKPTDNGANIYIHGVSFYPPPFTLDWQHEKDQVLYQWWRADCCHKSYQDWRCRRLSPHVELFTYLRPSRSLVVTFRFDARERSRVSIFTYAGQIAERTLGVSQRQFEITVEGSGGFLSLFFIHVNRVCEHRGGQWFFRGIRGDFVLER